MKYLARLFTLLLLTSCGGSGGDDASGSTGSGGTDAPNDPPVASDDTSSTTSNTDVLIDVLINDVDPENDTLTVLSVSGSLGTTTIVDNKVNYSPLENWTGTDSFNYSIKDTGGNQATALVTVEVSSSSPDRLLFRGDINNEINFTVPEGYAYAMVEGHFWNVEAMSPTALRDAAFFGWWYSVDVTGVDGVSDSFGNNSMLMRLLPSAYDDSRNRIWLYPGTSIRIYPGTDPAANLTLWVERFDI